MHQTKKYHAGLQENVDAEDVAISWIVDEYTELPWESCFELSTHQRMCLVHNRHPGGWNAYVDLVDPEFSNSGLYPAPTVADTYNTSRSWLPPVAIAAARRWLRDYGFDSELLDELFDWQLANLANRVREGELQEYGTPAEGPVGERLQSSKSGFNNTAITRRPL